MQHYTIFYSSLYICTTPHLGWWTARRWLRWWPSWGRRRCCCRWCRWRCRRRCTCCCPCRCRRWWCCRRFCRHRRRRRRQRRRRCRHGITKHEVSRAAGSATLTTPVLPYACTVHTALQCVSMYETNAMFNHGQSFNRNLEKPDM